MADAKDELLQWQQLTTHFQQELKDKMAEIAAANLHVMTLTSSLNSVVSDY